MMFFFQYSNFKNFSFLKKKTETFAKELEVMKMDLEMIKKNRDQIFEPNGKSNNSDMRFLNRKLSEMKSEIVRLKDKNDVAGLTEYKEREERIWKEYAEDVIKTWSTDLNNKLNEKGFSDEESEDVLIKYEDMLEKTKDMQLKWYRGDISDDEINSFPAKIAKDFYKEISNDVGEQKASIVLGVIFPDASFRKSLFEKEEN